MADARRRLKRQREQEFAAEKKEFEEEKKKMKEEFEEQIRTMTKNYEKQVLHLKQKLWAEQSNHVSLQNLLKRDKDNAQKSAIEADARTLKVKEVCEADLQRHLADVEESAGERGAGDSMMRACMFCPIICFCGFP